MYYHTLVADVGKVIEGLRAVRGEFKLAMLYNRDLSAKTNWNLIVSSDWTDALGISKATRLIAHALHENLERENWLAIGRVTVLKPQDPFVRDMTHLHAWSSPGGGKRLNQVSGGGVTEGAGYVFYAQPEIPA